MANTPNPVQLRSPISFIQGLERTPEYSHLMTKHDGDRQIAIGISAMHFARNMNQRSETPEQRLDAFSVQLIGQIPAYFEGTVALQGHHNGERWDRKGALEKVIPLNHTLRDMVDYFPSMTVDSLRTFCTTAGRDLLHGSEARQFDQMIFDAIVGMQQEIALEQVLWTIEGVDDVFKAETVEEERRGVDVTVIYKGIEIYLDAKSSQMGVQEAPKKQLTRSYRTSSDALSGYPVYTGIRYEEFKGFRAPRAAVERSAGRIARVLEERYQAITSDTLLQAHA